MGEVETNLTERINTEHRAVEEAARSAVEHAMNAGDMLEEKKASLAHGEWGAWLEANFEGSQDIAGVYMKLARNREVLGNSERARNLSIRGALKELSAPAEEGSSTKIDEEEISPEELAELIRGLMQTLGPPLDDGEWEPVERRLTQPGKEEHDLLADMNVEHMKLLGSIVAVGGFILEPSEEEKLTLSYRNPEKTEIHTVELPTDREDLRELVKRGCRAHAVARFKMWRLLSGWATRVVAAESRDAGLIEARIQRHAGWREGDTVAEYFYHQLMEHKDDAWWFKAKHQLSDKEFNDYCAGLEVWVQLEARDLEGKIFSKAA